MKLTTGVAGVDGNGQSELVEAIAGLRAKGVRVVKAHGVIEGPGVLRAHAAARGRGSPPVAGGAGARGGYSGATWPMQKPHVPPEKRPSVMSATVLPSPAPFRAPVMASISRMPGPPFGPS